ncbi:MAG: NUDIX hydrolase [Syntrophales bacterium]|jgi:ADP-ribose pyrophosphatase|nr:NUDIX hydrolase [Syntrophales bacterium]MCK9391625.1 NUDIX hydrolase [Syntrophales bacterium]
MSRREYPQKPIVGVGAIVVREGKVLLVKRAAAPSRGLWAIPGGSLELGETLQRGAEREILEETGIRIRAGAPVYAFDFLEYDASNRLQYHFVVVDMEAEYVAGEVQAADDALDARWVSPEELPGMSVSGNTLKILKERGFISS